MADTRKITIEIIQKNEGDDTPKIPDEDKDKKKSDSEGKTLLKSVILNQGYKVAKKLVIQGVESSMNRYLTLSEDYMAQNVYNAVKVSIDKATTAGTAIIGGGLAGAKVAGVPGAIAGIVIGSVGFGVSEFLSYQSRMSGYYRTLNASNIEMSFARKRAGLMDGSKGTEN